MNSKHTPGPWKWDGADKLCGEFGQVVAVLAREPYAPDNHEEDIANQRLLSSAPDLLKALKEVEKQLFDSLEREGKDKGKINVFPAHQNNRASESLRMARAAIRKAEQGE